MITGLGHWVQIAVQKYVHPMAILDWIRVSDKKKKNISICWKAVLWAFDIIGNNIVWNVGNGADLHIGIDPWGGYKWRQHLPTILIDKLHSAGIFFLKDIGGLGMIHLMEQGWISVDNLRLSDIQDVLCWNGFLATLKASHVRLTNNADILVWNL